jgi:hypothetical protein
VRRGVGQHALELVDGGASSDLPQLEQLADIIVGLVRQDLSDGALVDCGCRVAAGIHRR